jgi:glycyl-tRNA synthetase (class II)
MQKEYGFIFPSSEIYDGGLSAVYDCAQTGVELKKRTYRELVEINGSNALS